VCKRTKRKLLPETLELEVAKTERARVRRKSRARERRGERQRERLRPGSMCAVQHTVRIEALSR